MSRLEAFSLYSGIVGLAVNVISLSGLILGFYEASPDVSFLISAPAITIFTLSLMIYSFITLMMFILKATRNRWKNLGLRPSGSRQLEGKTIISYLLWSPIFALWVVSMHYLWGIGAPTPEEPPLLIGAGLMGTFLAPILLAKIVRSLDGFINPQWIYNENE